jgi:predicted RNA binding protein YcfA (HicA-like mRNA interferase family)
MKTAESYDILQKNGRFIVTKNGSPIQLPKSDGQSIITEFDTKEDAQKYLDILKSLKRRNHR